MKFSPVLFAATAALCLSNCKTMDYLIGPPLPRSTPRDEEAQYQQEQQRRLPPGTPAGPTPFAPPESAGVQANPYTRANIYNTIPKVLAMKRPPASEFSDPPNVADARLSQIEAVVRHELEAKGYSIGGAGAQDASVQIDYETSPTLVVGGTGWDYSVTVTFMLGGDSIGNSSCRWLNTKPGSFESLLKTLTTQAVGKVPAEGKQQ